MQTPKNLRTKKMNKIAILLALLSVCAFVGSVVLAKPIEISLNKKELDTSDARVAAWVNTVRIAQKTGGLQQMNRAYLRAGASPVVPLNDYADTQVSVAEILLGFIVVWMMIYVDDDCYDDDCYDDGLEIISRMMMMT